MLSVGLQRALADLLFGVVGLLLTLSSDTRFLRIRLLPGFWWAFAVIAGAVVVGMLAREVAMRRLRRAAGAGLALTGVLSLVIATQVGTTTAMWQSLTPSRPDAAPVWACLIVDVGMAALGLWLLRLGIASATRSPEGVMTPVAADGAVEHP